MTPSLRKRLLVGTALGFCIILLGAGCALYYLMEHALVGEFDRGLLARAQTLADLVEQEGSRIDLEFEEADLGDFRRVDRPEYFQVWRDDGTVLRRSPSLAGADLPGAAGTAETALGTCALPDGRRGRCVWLRFVPRIDGEVLAIGPEQHLVLGLARGVESITAAMAQLRVTLLVVGALTVVLAIGVLAWLVGIGLRPARQLAERINEIDETRLAERLDLLNLPDELRPIGAQLNELLDRLDAAFAREQAMTANVAHELRTPLAGLRNIMEVALSRRREGVDYRRALEDCQAICLQTQMIVENVLALARLESHTDTRVTERVELRTLFDRAWEPFGHKADIKDLVVSWDVPDVQIETDPRQLGLVLGNLLDNAVHYSDEAGRLAVAGRCDDGAITISISNSGSQVAAADVHRVFDRFWRGDTARQQDGARCGLGLPLCRMIIERLGGTMAANSTPAGEFTASFTLASVTKRFIVD